MCKYIQQISQWNIRKGELLPSVNDFPPGNSDDCLMLPHRFTNTKKCNASLAQGVSYIWTKKILALKRQKSAILVAFFLFFFFFINLSNFCGTGEQRKGIALCFILITASDGLWITKPLNHIKLMQLPNPHLWRKRDWGGQALPLAKWAGGNHPAQVQWL